MDNREGEKEESINKKKEDVMGYVGGEIQKEMENKKMIWMKEKKKEKFDEEWKFLDMKDFIKWK